MPAGAGCGAFGSGQPTVFTGDGPYEADARQALTGQVRDALDRLRCPPVVVIGGSADYAGCIHLILAPASGWVVHVIRNGQATASWHSDHTLDELLRQILDHVGGTPTVIHL